METPTQTLHTRLAGLRGEAEKTGNPWPLAAPLEKSAHEALEAGASPETVEKWVAGGYCPAGAGELLAKKVSEQDCGWLMERGILLTEAAEAVTGGANITTVKTWVTAGYSLHGTGAFLKAGGNTTEAEKIYKAKQAANQWQIPNLEDASRLRRRKVWGNKILEYIEENYDLEEIAEFLEAGGSPAQAEKALENGKHLPDATRLVKAGAEDLTGILDSGKNLAEEAARLEKEARDDNKSKTGRKETSKPEQTATLENPPKTGTRVANRATRRRLTKNEKRKTKEAQTREKRNARKAGNYQQG